MKLFKQIIRAVIVSLLLLAVVLPVSVYVVVSTPWAQEQLRTIASNELSKVLGTEVSIGKIIYHPFNTIQLESVAVNDDNGRTALSVAKVATRFELWHFIRSRKFIFDYALIDGLDAQIYRASKSSPLSIDGIIKHLQPKDKNKPPTEFDLSIGTILIRNGRLRYDVLDQQPSPEKFNSNHIEVADLNLYAYLRQASRHGADVELEELSFREQSGFELSSLSAYACVSDSLIDIKRLTINLPHSNIAIKPIALHINGFNNLAKAVKSASLVLSTDNSATISTTDLAAFVPAFANIDRTFSADFVITSTCGSIDLNSFSIKDEQGTHIEMQAQVLNPFCIDNINVSLNELRATISATDLRYISSLLPQKTATIISRLGSVNLHGSGKGNVSSALANLNINIGNASIALNGSATSASRFNTFNFDVHSSIQDLPIGSLFTIADLGPLSADLDVDGSFAGKKSEGNMTATISQLSYRQYSYSSIDIEAAVDASLNQLTAYLSSSDPNADFSVDATIINQSTKNLSLDLLVGRLDLNALNISQKYPGYAISGEVLSNIAISDIDHCYGNLLANNFVIRNADNEGLSLNSLEIAVYPNATDSTSTDISLSSDCINGYIQGKITPSTLVPTFVDMASHIVPDIIPHDSDRHQLVAESNNLFDIDLTIENAEEISRFLNLPVQLIYPIDINGSVNGPKGQAVVWVDAPYLQQGDKIIDSSMLGLTVDAQTNCATIYATTHTPTKKGPMNVVLGIQGSNNHFNTAIDWEIERAVPINGTINFSTALSRSDNKNLCISTDFHPGQITFGDDIWHINSSNITWCDNVLSVSDFALQANNQRIAIDGVGSTSPDDVMDVSLENIHLISIFETLGIDNALISGTASGTFQARSILSKIPILTTDNLHVDQIGYNYCTIGDADVTANWDNDRQSFHLDADIINANDQHSRIYGDIFAAQGALDLTFDVTHAPVGFMRPFMAAFTSAIDGYVSGKAHLFGTFKDIDMEGDIFAQDLRLKIDFTNTWYSATDSIHVKPGRIQLDNITIRDVDGHTALLNGYLLHDYFHRPVFDFQISEAKNFLCYNVSAKQNDLWYGTIYGNGSASIVGRPGIVEIGANMTTAPHSTFTFVLSDQLEAQEYSFINFRDVTPEDTTKSVLKIDDLPQAVKDYQQRMRQQNIDKPSDYVMDITVDVTPDAEMIVVMDPIGGDRIRAFGKGNIRMAYNSADNDIYLWGLYTLDHGKYNFTLQDIIIKDFTINQGSSIEFNGDPYSAILNIEAIYQLNANLSDLDESFTQDKDLNRTNVPVQAVMIVTDDMRQPDIRFDLKFPTLNADVYRKVRSIVSTDDMMNRQIIYLLALNRFYTPDYMASTTKSNELFSVASSTISSQLSSMLGKLSDNWSIAPNLRSDQGDFSDLEVDLALSSRLLNNRLLFNGNFGYRDKSLNSNQFVGDFDIEYLLTPSGNWRLKAYNRYNDQNYYLRTATTTQGVGIMFRHDFDYLFRKPARQSSPAAEPTDSIPSDSSIIINNIIPD